MSAHNRPNTTNYSTMNCILWQPPRVQNCHTNRHVLPTHFGSNKPCVTTFYPPFCSSPPSLPPRNLPPSAPPPSPSSTSRPPPIRSAQPSISLPSAATPPSSAQPPNTPV